MTCDCNISISTKRKIYCDYVVCVVSPRKRQADRQINRQAKYMVDHAQGAFHHKHTGTKNKKTES